MITHPTLMRPRSGRRAGFTLIELIVIIAILAALAALTAAATLRMIVVQQKNNTENALSKLQSHLDNSVKAAVDKWKTEPIDGTTQTFILNNLSGNADANAMDRMRVIYVKLKLRQYYPETLAEALNPAPLPPLGSYVKYLANYGITQPSAGAYQYESGACLAMALQVGFNAGGISLDDLGKGGVLATAPIDPGQNTQMPTPGPGTGSSGTKGTPQPTVIPNVPMLLDAWGTPICFSRFPSGCPSTNPAGPKPGSHDPLDTKATLMNPQWPQNCRNTFSSLLLQDLAPSTPTGVGQSYYLWPTLGSAGPDGKFGVVMYNFSSTAQGANLAQAADNIYSTPAGAGGGGAGQ